MSFEMMRISLSILFTSAGRATVAPARSSFNMIETGLNHQRFWGLEQCVIPLLVLEAVAGNMRENGLGNLLVIIAFAEVPETDLVEVV